MKFSKMDIRCVTPSLWITDDHKCVSVEVRSSYHQLVTQNLQDNREAEVQVYYIMYAKRKCMAFCFEVGGERIFPFTDGKDIKFTVLSPVLSSNQEAMEDTVKETLNEMFLFQWVEAGTKDWRSLKSVAKPSMYLFADKNKVTIKPLKMSHFRINKKVTTETSKSERDFIPKKLNMTTPYERVSLVSRDSNCAATKGKARRFRRS